MDLAAVDRSATQGGSWLHSAAAGAKLAALAIVLASAIVSWNPFVLATTTIALAAVAVSARLPARLTLLLAGYPAIFAAIFVFASATDVSGGTTILLKAVTAALAAVLVVLSTPYPRIFAPIQRVTPALVGDSLLITYRTAFLLLEKFAHTLRSVRLRAGLRGRHPIRAGRATTLALGSVLLYAMDLSQRDYDVMRVRGYERRLRIAPPSHRDPIASAIAILGAAGLLGVSILWRAEWRVLNPWSWLLPLPALALLAVTGIVRWRTP